MGSIYAGLLGSAGNEVWAREAGVKFNTWEAVPPAGTPSEHVIRPAFWANVARRMKMGDKIIVVPRDGGWVEPRIASWVLQLAPGAGP